MFNGYNNKLANVPTISGLLSIDADDINSDNVTTDTLVVNGVDVGAQVAINTADITSLKQVTTGQTYASVGDTTTFDNNLTVTATNTLTTKSIALTAGATISSNSLTISDVELGYLDGVTSNIQTQLNNRVDLTTAQSIGGIKTFTTLPETSIAPTTANQLTNKTYVDSNFVDKTTAQSIGGVKTFTTLPETSIAPTTANQLTNKTYVDSNFVDKTTAQSIGGIKTFTSVPVCATAPTTGTQLTNKTYVDSVAGSATTVNLTNTSLGATNYMVMSATSSGTSSLLTDSSFATYDGTTQTAYINISGRAATATKVAIDNAASGSSNYLVMTTTGGLGFADLITDNAGATYDSTTNTADLNITGTAPKVGLIPDNANITCYIPFSKTVTTSNNQLFIDNGTTPMTYNPNQGFLTVSKVSASGLILQRLNSSSMNASVSGYGNLTTGDFNTAIGGSVLNDLTTGNDNVGIGHNTQLRNSNSSNNLTIGTNSGFNLNAIGNPYNEFNVCFGGYSGYNGSNMGYTILMGGGSGSSIINGTYNTCCGAGADCNNNLTFATAIGASAVCTTSNTVQLGRAADKVNISGTMSVAKPVSILTNTGTNDPTLLIQDTGTGNSIYFLPRATVAGAFNNLCQNGDAIINAFKAAGQPLCITTSSTPAPAGPVGIRLTGTSVVVSGGGSGGISTSSANFTGSTITFTGTATFNSVPNTSIAPATGNDLCNRTYVDGIAATINTTVTPAAPPAVNYYPTYVLSATTLANQTAYVDPDVYYNSGSNTLNVPNLTSVGTLTMTGGNVITTGNTTDLNLNTLASGGNVVIAPKGTTALTLSSTLCSFNNTDVEINNTKNLTLKAAGKLILADGTPTTQIYQSGNNTEIYNTINSGNININARNSILGIKVPVSIDVQTVTMRAAVNIANVATPANFTTMIQDGNTPSQFNILNNVTSGKITMSCEDSVGTARDLLNLSTTQTVIGGDGTDFNHFFMSDGIPASSTAQIIRIASSVASGFNFIDSGVGRYTGTYPLAFRSGGGTEWLRFNDTGIKMNNTCMYGRNDGFAFATIPTGATTQPIGFCKSTSTAITVAAASQTTVTANLNAGVWILHVTWQLTRGTGTFTTASFLAANMATGTGYTYYPNTANISFRYPIPSTATTATLDAHFSATIVVTGTGGNVNPVINTAVSMTIGTATSTLYVGYTKVA